MPLQEPTTSKLPTTVGVEKTQPPLSNFQRMAGAMEGNAGLGCWAAGRIAISKTEREFHIRNFIGSLLAADHQSGNSDPQ
jgi:hypothetical protein